MFKTKVTFTNSTFGYLNYQSNFKECEQKDYVDNGLNIDLKNYFNRFCPDFESLKDIIQVKNGYSNKTERVAFGFTVVVCDKHKDKSCANSDQIDLLLSKLILNTFILDQSVEFGNVNNLGKNPIIK